jgi:signal transduction histidine kinase
MIIYNFINYIKKHLNQDMQGIEPYFVPFGWVMLSFVPFYFLNLHLHPGGYENLPLRVAVALVGLGFMFYRYWPSFLIKKASWLWVLALTFTMPFFFSFMFFMNKAAGPWSIKELVGLTILTFFVGWVMYVILVCVGIFAAWAMFCCLATDPVLPTSLWLTFGNYSVPVIYFWVLAAHKAQNKIKLEAMRMLGGVVAHEMRTPLMTVRAGTQGILYHFQELVSGYRKAREVRLLEAPMADKHLNLMQSTLRSLDRTAQEALFLIDMLLMRCKEYVPDAKRHVCDMATIVNDVLAQYPFKERERSWVHVPQPQAESFQFLGEENFVRHVLFNLIKNSLQAIHKAGKGQLELRWQKGERGHQLYVEDTALGVPAHELNRIFDRFYTRTDQGNGIGLAFCKLVMTALGGSIICESVLGQYTRFILSFPALNQAAPEVEALEPATQAVCQHADASVACHVGAGVINKTLLTKSKNQVL